MSIINLDEHRRERDRIMRIIEDDYTASGFLDLKALEAEIESGMVWLEAAKKAVCRQLYCVPPPSPDEGR